MKPMRFLTVAFVLLGMVATASALTHEGEVITNQASGAYSDANGNEIAGATEGYVLSNTVSTTVSQVAGATFESDLTANMAALSSTMYTVDFQNTGNGNDTYDINFTYSGTADTYEISVFSDVGEDGLYVEGTDTLFTVFPFVSPTLDMLDEMVFFVKIEDTTSAGAPDGNQPVLTFTATSNFVETPSDLVVSDQILLTTTIQAAAVNGEIAIVNNPNPAPGESIDLEACFINSGGAIAYDLVFSTEMPSNTTLDESSVSINNGTALTLNTGGAATYVGGVLTINLGDLGYTNPNEVCVQFSVVVDSELDAEDPIEFPADNPSLTYENPDGDPYPIEYPEEDSEWPEDGIVVDQVYDVTLAGSTESFEGNPGDSLFFDFIVTNTGNGPDFFQLTSSSDYITWTFYVDDNDDGIFAAAEEGASAITNTGEMAADAVNYYIAVGVIAAGTADDADDATTFTATSRGDDLLYDGTDVTDTDSVTGNCTAPIILSGNGGLFKQVSPTGNVPPGDTLTYTLTVLNSGSGDASDVVITDDIPEFTTYVDDSMTLAGSSVTDAAPDADGGSATTSGGDNGNGVVTFDLGTLAAGTSKTMTFQVTVD